MRARGICITGSLMHMMKNYDIRQRCIIKQKKIAFTEDDFQFTQITNHNVGQFPLIRKLYPDYKIQVLKHQGESPYGRKIFRAQFDNVIAQVSEQHGTVRDIFIAMHVEGELIGFALIEGYRVSEKKSTTGYAHGMPRVPSAARRPLTPDRFFFFFLID